MSASASDKQVRSFLRAIQPTPDAMRNVKASRGEVVQDNLNGTVDVTIAAGAVSIEAAYLDHYSPTVGDDVIILAMGVDRIVIGKLA